MNNQVHIIIPNWNGSKFLMDCLASLTKITYSNYSIVVVDNGSTDNSVKLIKDRFPQVEVLLNQHNEGFAAACNRGIEYGLAHGAEYILLLNNDTEVDRNFLSIMVEAISKPEVGIVGSKIYYFDEPDKIWFAGGKFIWWRASGQHMYWQKTDEINLTGIISCDFITGCNMLIKKEVFDTAGFFYEPYFLTVEDLDFCYQASRRGWQIKVALDAKIWHKVSSSRLGEFSFSNGYYGTRNRLFFAVKKKNFFGALIFLCAVFPVRTIQWIIEEKFQMLKGMIFGIGDYFRGRMGKIG